MSNTAVQSQPAKPDALGSRPISARKQEDPGCPEVGPPPCPRQPEVIANTACCRGHTVTPQMTRVSLETREGEPSSSQDLVWGRRAWGPGPRRGV